METEEPTQPPRSIRDLLSVEAVRFVVAGAANTIASWLIYVGFLWVMSYVWAYSLSYVIGIALAYWVNSKFVFRAAMSWKKAFQFPSVYLVQYVIGLGVVYACVEWLGIGEAIAPIAGLVLTLPLSFLMSRWIIRGH